MGLNEHEISKLEMSRELSSFVHHKSGQKGGHLNFGAKTGDPAAGVSYE